MAINNTSAISFTPGTLQHLMLNAGACYSNYGLENELLMGCSSGGNEFDITPKTRDIAADGIHGVFLGSTQLVSTDVTLKINFLEVTTAILVAALMAQVDSTTVAGYDVITGKTSIALTDYITNIAYVSTISGTDAPVIIILTNALSEDGIKFTSKDDADNIVPVTFTAHIDPTTPTVSPWEIRNPQISA
jgi:hypothetical protein